MLAVSQGPPFGTEDGFTPGDPAFFVEEARRERVTVLSERHDAIGGQPTRTVRFADSGDTYDVLENLLEACGRNWRPSPTDQHLQSPAKIGAPRHPDPMPSMPRPVASVLDAYGPRDAETAGAVVINPARLPSDQRRVYDQAMRLAGSKRRADKSRSKAMLLELQAEISAAQDGVAHARALAETMQLAHARGERMSLAINPADPRRPRARVIDHDGLASLTEIRDPISPVQYRGGLAYRAGWESRGRDLKAATAGEGGGGGHDNDAFVAARLKRAQDLQLVARIERAVAMRAARTRLPEALALLRRVAGDGVALSCFGNGWSFARNLKALKMALDVAADLSREEMRRPTNR